MNKTLYIVVDEMITNFGSGDIKLSVFDSKVKVKDYLKRFRRRNEYSCDDYEKEYHWPSFYEAFKRLPKGENVEKSWTYWSEDFYHTVYPAKMNDPLAYENFFR